VSAPDANGDRADDAFQRALTGCRSPWRALVNGARRFARSSIHDTGITLGTLSWMVGAVAIVPVVTVIVMALNSSNFLGFPVRGISLRWFGEVVRDVEWRSAFQTSLVIAAAAAPLATLLGALGALGIRGRRFQGSLRVIFLLPLVVPIVVTALAIYPFYVEVGLIGTTPGLILVHALLALPFTFVIVWGATHSLDPRLERAAASLGASRLQVYVRILLPLLWPALLGALAVAAVASFDETVATLFLSSPTDRTVPVVIWLHIANDFSPTAAAASTLVLAFNVVVMGVTSVVASAAVKRRSLPPIAWSSADPAAPSGGRRGWQPERRDGGTS
jgi:putative spermidine/putrescine transport system permease protein